MKSDQGHINGIYTQLTMYMKIICDTDLQSKESI